MDPNPNPNPKSQAGSSERMPVLNGAASRDDRFRGYVLARRDFLMRQAYLLTGDPQQAEDLVQTTLAKVYASWNRVQSSASPDAYVRRILINTNISWFRRRRVREVLTAAAPESAAPAPAETEFQEELIDALNALPEKQRAVVVLRYWEDLPEAEIAEALGCSVGTVRSHSSRALKKLRSSMSMQIGPVTAGRRAAG